MFVRPEGNGYLNVSSMIVPAAFFALACAFGQPLFVQQINPGPISIRTFAGRAECEANPVTPAPRLTAAILLDSIDGHDMDRVFTELTGLYRALHVDHPIALAALSGREWKTAGPFRSLPQFRTGLSKLLKPASAATDTYSATQFYEFLADSAAQFGSGWASVLFIGKLPPVDADLRDYVVAYLGSKFRAQRLRVSYWPVRGEEPEPWDSMARMTGGFVVKSGSRGTA